MIDRQRHSGGSWADVADRPPSEQTEWLIGRWRVDGTFAASTLARVGDLAGRYALRLQATGAGSLVAATDTDIAGFVTAPTRRNRPPAVATAHLRRVTLRALYRTIAQHGGPEIAAAALLDVPARRFGDTRPIHDDELAAVRTAAMLHRARRLYAPAVVALGEATATTGETAMIRWADIDVDRGVVALPGAGPVTSRTGILSGWGVDVLAVHHRRSCGAGSRLVALRADTSEETVTQAAVVMVLGRVLRSAAIASERLRPGSLRLCGPARVLQAGGRIEHAAAALGLTSLDTTARLLEWNWDQR